MIPARKMLPRQNSWSWKQSGHKTDAQERSLHIYFPWVLRDPGHPPKEMKKDPEKWQNLNPILLSWAKRGDCEKGSTLCGDAKEDKDCSQKGLFVQNLSALNGNNVIHLPADEGHIPWGWGWIFSLLFSERKRGRLSTPFLHLLYWRDCFIFAVF